MRPDRYLGVNPGWDNESRRPGKGRVLRYSSPRRYRDWLAESIALSQTTGQAPIFINAWNEWAEGAYLEPDARLGFANLRATRDALSGAKIRPIHDQNKFNDRASAIIHVWYPETLSELLIALAENSLLWNLIVTTTAELEGEVRLALKRSNMDFEIIIVPNHGRDILPFLIAAESIVDSGTDFVLKIHTKRSLHREDGEAWRRDLVSKLVALNQANKAVSLLNERSDIGLIAPAGHVVGLDYFWGANEKGVNFLTRRIGLPQIGTHSTTFVSGSMFWIRLAAIRPILDAHFLPTEFEIEKGQVDGTLAHAFERIIQHCIESQGFRTLELDIGQTAFPPSPRDSYPHAERP